MGKAGKWYYAVKKGRIPGIYGSWPEAEAQVKQFRGPMHMKFRSYEEAERWLGLPVDGTTNPYLAPRLIAGFSDDPRQPPVAEPQPGPVTVTNARDVPPPLVAGSSASLSSIIAYTDGAAKKNQDKFNRMAGYGIHWAAAHSGDIAEPLPGPPGEGHTNNVGELTAIIRVLELTKGDPRPLTIYSDSTYSIDCFDRHQGWVANGDKTASGKTPANFDMIRYMVALRSLRNVRKQKTAIKHVKGHADSPGNIAADRLANQGVYKPRVGVPPEPDWKRLLEEVEKEEKEVVAHMNGAQYLRSGAPEAVTTTTTTTTTTIVTVTTTTSVRRCHLCCELASLKHS
ncbi:ribonuclease H-like domain-containing protein [Vararia minispora EC-137]|uniref:Ribonuclease H-like domain-containing protein n=1 Tax=Vararia minispora EC-137 TaxID=1314806 RepID=A0ACB8QS82_9AGAM|nr:ribonuclease H-like domain-containing protein [Vararia minispora EC-137]